MITGLLKNKRHKILRKCMLKFCPLQSVNNVRIQLTGLYPIGSKACGGPTGFIAYSLKLNTNFLTKLKNTQIIKRIQYEMGIISTCDVPPSPTSIKCVNNTAQLVY
jgi:hypothetical protein